MPAAQKLRIISEDNEIYQEVVMYDNDTHRYILLHFIDDSILYILSPLKPDPRDVWSCKAKWSDILKLMKNTLHGSVTMVPTIENLETFQSLKDKFYEFEEWEFVDAGSWSDSFTYKKTKNFNIYHFKQTNLMRQLHVKR